MIKSWQKVAVAAATILGLGATAVKSAEAASVKLTFFQGLDTPVAVGSFSYDESTPYEAIFPSTMLGKPTLEIKASDKWFVVKDFAVTLFGLSWNLSQASFDRANILSPLLWAPLDPRSQLKVVTASFFPFGSAEPTVWGNWVFGNIRRLPNLAIFGNSQGPEGSMSWQQNGGVLSNGMYLHSGYVIAEEVKPGSENSEAVPEPATIAGLTLAAAGLGAAKKKFGASKV
ncbi:MULTISPECIES: PEP-CTERM sorting domain-containing protein [unclassified Microcoleus]|uniref:PEP-CTERM sorting domain-containing protein n=2 Tax=unclassified Microcoleus TaxID=2642155 RepID=UPI001DE9C02E|nr:MULTISPECIES: PEP-CTERM sorting domain-containing protein [unclassified Microcoleus]MCC3467137.1 PEP-CTERM sorting domain-containing protein [Microcoleus sp. PH2017_06_SFM_O_A]MCC3566784.1 PEP-CTERM sorting domain-containing protein [Microcoleus sp. PH2017_31_RDM_U_A]MCC3579077.1 PEP-CTERM sorting domain-containing protein [Microcoleus sp. PH2017_32_RDM_D_A]MCC3617181.1 PEP-CTERM sorting domain-containing protein [Microcoleus sp. PH2017_38_RDM_U_B]